MSKSMIHLDSMVRGQEVKVSKGMNALKERKTPGLVWQLLTADRSKKN